MFSFFKKKEPKKPSREEIIKQARANAADAREAIGEETLEKIRQHMANKDNSEFEQAKKKVMSMDRDRVIDNIRAMKRGEFE